MIENVNIKQVKLSAVAKVFADIKPDLIDGHAIYFGAFVSNKLIGIVSYVNHEHIVYLGHAFVLEEYREHGVYRMLVEYREQVIAEKCKGKTAIAHCNINSLKHLLKKGYEIEKTLFKITKKI